MTMIFLANHTGHLQPVVGGIRQKIQTDAALSNQCLGSLDRFLLCALMCFFQCVSAYGCTPLSPHTDECLIHQNIYCRL